MCKLKKLGLALSSGGARGLAHVGVIKVLEQNNIPIHYLAGTSMGAVIAAYYALYQEVDTIEKDITAFGRRDLVKLIDLNNPSISLVKGKKIREFLKKYFGNKTFKDTKIPLKIGATALNDGSKIVFSRGKIIDALMASGAVPGIFPAVNYRNKYLVDGGLADATPVELVKSMGPDVIVAVDLFSLPYDKNKKYDSLQKVLSRSYEILMSKLDDYKLKEYGKNIVVIRPHLRSKMQTFAFFNSAKNIKKGEIEARKNIKKIKRLMK